MQINIECPRIRQAYPDTAGQTVKWLSSDNQDEYKKNLKHKKHLLKKYNWIDTEIDYRINRYGFRCEEFTEDPSIVWLGCSIASGIGISEEHTFAYNVSNKLKLKNFNLSQAAGSNDSCFRIGSFWIPILKPKIVILIRPYEGRFEIINEKGEPEASPENQRSRLWVMQKLNRDIQLERNVAGLKYFSYSVGADFYNFCPSEIFNTVIEEISQSARDLVHPGITMHKSATKNILKNIKRDKL